MTQPHLLLVDASGFAFRSYYSFPPFYRESDGQPIGATLGYMQMLWNLRGAVQHDPASHGAAVFDPPPGQTFRHKLDPNYKANRDPGRRTEIDGQFAWMRNATGALGMETVEAKGYEADDVIATLATQAAAAGWRTTIVSSDKDFGQLVRDDVIEIVDPMARLHGKASARVREKDVRERWGVSGAAVAHVQALCGDAVDNIKGIRTCGPDRAAALVRRWKTIDGVIKNRSEIPWTRIAVEIGRNSETLRRNLKLTTLKCNVPLKMDLAGLEMQPILKSHLVKILESLEAKNMLTALFGLDRQDLRLVPKMDAKLHFEWWDEEVKSVGKPSKLPDMPQCGFYKRKLVMGGPFVAARIWREPYIDEFGQETDQEILRCVVGGKVKDPYQEWVRLSMNPIRAAEYEFMTSDASHARVWRPDSPQANPDKPIDLRQSPISRNPRSKAS